MWGGGWNGAGASRGTYDESFCNSIRRDVGKTVPQGLKPKTFGPFTARVNPCRKQNSLAIDS